MYLCEETDARWRAENEPEYLAHMESNHENDEVRRYSTPEVTVEWRAALCQHSGRCVRALPAVFAPKRRPWIIIGDTLPDTLEEAVARCPSGALRFVRHDTDASRA